MSDPAVKAAPVAHGTVLSAALHPHQLGQPSSPDSTVDSPLLGGSLTELAVEVDLGDGKSAGQAAETADTYHRLGLTAGPRSVGCPPMPPLAGAESPMTAALKRSAVQAAHEALARELCPHFLLHSGDPWGPSSVEYYLAHCALYCGSTEVIPRGLLDGPALAAATCQVVRPDGSRQVVRADEAGTGWSLHPDPRCFGGFRHDMATAPIYVRVRDSGGDLLELTYVTFYPFNGWYPVLCGLLQAGAHAADIEHITLRVRRNTRELHSVFFASHRYRDGEWKVAKDCEFDPRTGRLRAYVARGGHGHYWRRGRHLRLYGFGNDVCDGKDAWDPQANVVLLDPHRLTPGHEWLQYKGLWGPTSVSSMTEQEWFWRECPRSRGWFKRLFCQCAK
mmetsp:Transcript_23194/g.74628  ORF Transcript_23194/g.74628 Transcript_23194/m.74628 type:complete len:391 (-) Transcript_23194:17-1189(-)